MRLAQPLGNGPIAMAAIALAVITFAVHGWNRISHHVVSLPTPEEKQAALLVFIITLIVGYGVAFVLHLLSKEASGDRRWPIYGIIAVVTGIFLSVMFISVGDLIPGSLGAYQDVIGIFLAYVAMILAYTFAVKKAISSWRAGYWSGVIANASVVLVSGAIIFIISGMIVYFE